MNKNNGMNKTHSVKIFYIFYEFTIFVLMQLRNSKKIIEY